MRKHYLLTIALVVLAVVGIIAFGNYLNDRSPKTHAPLDTNAAWWVKTNAP